MLATSAMTLEGHIFSKSWCQGRVVSFSRNNHTATRPCRSVRVIVARSQRNVDLAAKVGGPLVGVLGVAAPQALAAKPLPAGIDLNDLLNPDYGRKVETAVEEAVQSFSVPEPVEIPEVTIPELPKIPEPIDVKEATSSLFSNFQKDFSAEFGGALKRGAELGEKLQENVEQAVESIPPPPPVSAPPPPPAAVEEAVKTTSSFNWNDLLQEAPKATKVAPAPSAPVVIPPSPPTPSIEIPDVEIPTMELPTEELPAVELPSMELPAVELPSVELPTVELPSIELPAVELPTVELPSFELPSVSDVKESFNEAVSDAQDSVSDAISDSVAGAKSAVTSQLDNAVAGSKNAFAEATRGPREAFMKEFRTEFGGLIDEYDKFTAQQAASEAAKVAARQAGGDANEGAVGGALPQIEFDVDSVIGGTLDTVKSGIDGQLAVSGSAIVNAVAQVLPEEVMVALREVSGGSDSDVAALILGLGIGLPLFTAITVKIAGSLGYEGDVAPGDVLGALMTNPKAILIDTRSEKEIVLKGVPDLRGPSRNRVALCEVEPLQGSLRRELKDPYAVELEIFASKVKAVVGAGGRAYFLDSNGNSKSLARAVSAKGGVKAYVVEGGIRRWASDGLRTKEAYDVTAADFLVEEGQDFVQPFLTRGAITVDNIKNATPLDVSKFVAILLALIAAAANYEIVLELIGIYGLVLTFIIKSIKTEGGAFQVLQDASETVGSSVDSVKSTAASASELAVSLQSQVTNNAESKPKEDSKGFKLPINLPSLPSVGKKTDEPK